MKDGGIHKFCWVAMMGLLLTFSQAKAQPPDTFEIWINRVTDDSLRLKRALDVAKYYDNIDSSLAWKYFRIAKIYSDKMNTLFSRVSITEMEGILSTKTSPAKAYAFYKQAIELARTADTSRVMKSYEASLNNNLGVISYMNGDYEGAVNSFIESVLIYEKYGDPGRNLPPTLNNIASTYTELSYYSKALEYSRRAVQEAERISNGNVPSMSYIGFANCMLNTENYDSALAYLLKGLAIARKNNNQYDIYLCYGNLASYYEKKKNYDSALAYFQRAVPVVIAINAPFDIFSARNKLANIYITMKNPKAAKEQIDSIDVISRKYGFRDLNKLIYYVKSRYYESIENYSSSYEYYKKYDELKDSLLTETRLKRIDFLEEKYQSDKKQLAIEDLQTKQKVQQFEIRQKSVVNYLLFGGLIVIVVIASLIYRNLKHKQLLSKQTEQLHATRIKELEQEKQLISMNSLLKGQEEERGRLAKDLHDGLGGMLSGVKLSLGAMKGNLILSEDNARLFTKTLGQLDNSISEMRRVAHNMMPEALVRLGLQQAVQDYCDGLTESQALKINCQFHGLEKRLDAPTEIIVYRIVQELLNNVVKHSAASQVFVQIMRHETSLNITLEDNGKGFDVGAMESMKGAGLSNVRTRVEYLKGNLDIQSSPGKGTSVHIDCMIDDN